MFNGDRVQVKSILKVDRTKDFALLQLPKGTYSTLEIGDSSKLENFNFLSALGFLSENINSLEHLSGHNKTNKQKV